MNILIQPSYTFLLHSELSKVYTQLTRPCYVFLQLWMKCGHHGAGNKGCLQVKGNQLLAFSSFKLLSYTTFWENFKRRHFRKGKGNAFNEYTKKLDDFQACLSVKHLWTRMYNEWFRSKLIGVSHNWKHSQERVEVRVKVKLPFQCHTLTLFNRST